MYHCKGRFHAVNKYFIVLFFIKDPSEQFLQGTWINRFFNYTLIYFDTVTLEKKRFFISLNWTVKAVANITENQNIA